MQLSDTHHRADPAGHAPWLLARAAALPRGTGLPGPDILDSWLRCQQAGLDSGAAALIPVVDAADLAQRREHSATVRRLAQAELETLAQQIAGSNFLLAFADRDGVILDLFADHRFAMSDPAAPILPGSLWSEAVGGTNGLGTALATGRPVAVSGAEHYFLGLGDISCTAAPVRDAQGEVVGVLDASSYVQSRQRHTQALVQMAATHIENGLLVHQMGQRLVLAIHPRAEFLGTLSAGLLAFDDAGRLLTSNARGRQLLHGLAALPGMAFEDLFGLRFADVQGPLHRGAELRLRDLLGSALVARCANQAAWAAAGRHPAPAWPSAGALQRRPRPLPAAEPEPTIDPQVTEAYRLIDAAVQLRVPILIQGETGSGKEALARHAHQASGRRGAFIAVNCGALPAELFEAELFGYVGGSFTGARRDGSPGLIVSADGGTLLLDEVRELPPQLQAALLRFLDDQQVRPVGGSAMRQVDVQLLAATHAALDDEVAARRFRADLLYRLNTVRVTLPPLRQRRDFATAVRQLLAGIDAQASIDDAALQRLRGQPWPGNFRELRAVLTRALLAGQGRALGLAQVDALLPPAGRADHSNAPPGGNALQLGASALVRDEFDRTGGSVSQTSRNLGISRTTVYRHLKASGIAGAGLARQHGRLPAPGGR